MTDYKLNLSLEEIEMTKDYPIGTRVAYDTSALKPREGVVVGYDKNDVGEKVLMVCWSDYVISKCHVNNVYKLDK